MLIKEIYFIEYKKEIDKQVSQPLGNNDKLFYDCEIIFKTLYNYESKNKPGFWTYPRDSRN